MPATGQALRSTIFSGISSAMLKNAQPRPQRKDGSTLLGWPFAACAAFMQLRTIRVFILAAAVSTAANSEDAPEQPFLVLNLPAPTAQIRSIEFRGSEVLSAGLDKLVRRWEFSRTRGLIPRESLRWPIEHGHRGAIYAMAVSPDHRRVAIGGLGYSGGVGEIGQIDLTTGQLDWLEINGHRLTSDKGRRVVVALDYSSDGKWLVSRDATGRTLVRDVRQPPGTPRELVPSFANIKNDFWPLAVTGSEVLVPVPVTVRGGPVLQWQIKILSLDANANERELEGFLNGSVLAMDATAEGSAVVATDATNPARLLYWPNLTSQPEVIALGGHPGFSLSLDPAGQQVLVGTNADANRPGQLRLIKLGTKQTLFSRPAQVPVWACALSADAQHFAYSQGNAVLAGNIDQPQLAAEVSSGASVTGVQFLQGAAYPLRFSTAAAGEAETIREFNLATQHLRTVSPAIPLRRAEPALAGWSASIINRRQAIEITHPQRRIRNVIPLDRQSQGYATTFRWIPGADGQPDALAVGTEASDFCLQVFDHLTGSVLRAFRGHQGPVTAIDVAPDGRYLASGSSDGTVRIWNLTNLRQGRQVMRRWGADFERAGQQLRVTEVIDPGPLFDKGVRVGDLVSEIAWIDPQSGQRRIASTIEDIYRALQVIRWDVQVGFQFIRNEQALPRLQMAGWHDLVALLIAEPNWIAWTPAGYYTCSAGGERLIGWQVNGEIGQPPAFYEAIKFRKVFYRPDAMSRLLDTGRLSRALAAVAPPPQPDRPPVVEAPKQVAEVLPPIVRLISPAAEEITVQQPELTITAKAEAAPNSPPPTHLKLLIGGSPAPEHVRDLAPQSSEETWVVRLDPGVHELQILAETQRGFQTTRKLRVTYEPEKERRNLYVLAIGAGDYLPPLALAFANQDAYNFAGTLKTFSGGLYDAIEVRLVNDLDPTKAGILDGFRWLSKNMSQRDVGIVFYAGHGFRNQDGFYFVPVDGDMQRLEQTCIHESLIKEFCREMGGRGQLVMMLDACHSGAVQVDRLALELADPTAFNVLAMVSSSGEEKSYEHARWKAGAFTRAVTDGLRGEADNPKFPDGQVDFFELYVYVYNSVRAMVKEIGQSQTPLINAHYQAPFPLTEARE